MSPESELLASVNWIVSGRPENYKKPKVELYKLQGFYLVQSFVLHVVICNLALAKISTEHDTEVRHENDLYREAPNKSPV